MSASGVSQEIIVDLRGEPMHADAAVVLKALDRLLTVGAYYSDDHDQYLRAVGEACAVMTNAIRPRPSLALEIAANGLLVQGQVVDPHHRSVRKLHDLLVPLNIARLEFLADLTPPDLRCALAALQEHRRNLGQAGGFREVSIDNLPATVCIASRRIGQSGGGERVSLDELLSRWDDVAAPASCWTAARWIRSSSPPPGAITSATTRAAIPPCRNGTARGRWPRWSTSATSSRR